MPSHLLKRSVYLGTLLALGLSAGCASMSKPETKKPDPSAGTILTSDSQPNVTRQESADVWIALGRSFEEEGKDEEARAAYVSALKKDSRRPDAELRLAILDERGGNLKESERHFAQAMKLDPKNPDLLCDRGYSLYQRKLLGDAETMFRQSLAINPLHQRSHNNLALVLARRGDTQAALKEFAKAGCDSADAHANLGLILAMEGHFDESKKEYVQALAAKPTSTTAARGLQATITALAGQGDPTALATRVVKQTPTPPATTNNTDPNLMRTSGQRAAQ